MHSRTRSYLIPACQPNSSGFIGMKTAAWQYLLTFHHLHSVLRGRFTIEMHSALEIHELLHLIFRNLLGEGSDDCLDLLSCCLTCKAFTEPALDLMWEKLSSVALMPFASPLKYNTEYNPDGEEFDGSAYSEHLERLKFYGKRVRWLRVHSKLTPELLKCIMKIGGDPSPIPSSPSSLMSKIFPGLTKLSIVLSVNPLFENLSEPRIWTFFVPSVKDLSFYCGAAGRYDHVTDALRSVKAAQSSLTSLTLGPEIISDFSEPPPSALVTELSSLIQSLPQLKRLHIPLYFIAQPVLDAIVRLPALEQLTLSHPTYVQWRRSVPMGNFLPAIQVSQPGESLSCLRCLTVNSTFGFIPQALYMHPSLTSQVSHLSLSCLPPAPRLTLRPLFLPTLSSPALHSLTYLSLDFTVHISVPQRDGLGADFFAPLFAAPFISRLVSFHVRHRVPLDMTDKEFDDMARLMPNLESLRLIVMPFDAPRGVPHQPPVRIRASLVALASFTRHCASLREITLPVDAETLLIPEIEFLPAPAVRHPVVVDMSVSPVGEDFQVVAMILAKIFPHKRSVFTSQWSDRVPDLAKGVKADDVGIQVEGRKDFRQVYARRWKTIGGLVHGD
ncbi:hypothetical protein FPV67DRAFT_993978 [Lyophyllum atratum]|nr:hypothetical protein FPV67DRAFT_993978 [Lyophyllum atratum]